MTRLVRIPADVDREDRLVAGLTARQLALLATGAAGLALSWSVAETVVPVQVFVAVAAPFGASVTVLALARFDGQSADRLFVAALRHAGANRRLVPAPEGVPALPCWAGRDRLPAPLPFPVKNIGESGTLDLGAEGVAVLCRASSLDFALRTEEEQAALVAALGRWLNSLDTPVQILVRAERVHLAPFIERLVEGAPALPHPALEAAARDHAAHLAELGEARNLLRRVVLVVFRRPQGQGADELARRLAQEAARSLASAGLTVVSLREEEALTALASAAEPDVGRRRVGPGTGQPVRGAG